jgi:hypothetical protein
MYSSFFNYQPRIYEYGKCCIIKCIEPCGLDSQEEERSFICNQTIFKPYEQIKNALLIWVNINCLFLSFSIYS